jgi:hypothetical protein
MKVNQEIDKMIKENMFGEEDRKLAKFILSLFKYSPKKLSKSKDKDYRIWYKNLVKNNVIKDYMIIVSKDWEEHSGIEFIMIMMCAKGYIKRSK